jgi:glycosyltransferase involved in cell wall biosynthesis
VKNIVAVGHYAARTGAPLLLLDVVRSLTKRPEWAVSVVLHRGGDLAEAYADVAPTTVAWRSPRRRTDVHLAARYSFQSRRPATAARWVARRQGRVDLAYVNTTSMGHYAAAFKARGAHVITHVHELGDVMEQTASDATRAMVTATDTYIAVSQRAADDLVEVTGADPRRVHVVPGGIAAPRPISTSEVGALRRRLGIPDHAFVVGAVGTRDWRKGPDLFVHIARRSTELLEGTREVRFIWLGGDDRRTFGKQLMQDRLRSRLAEHLIFEPTVEEPSVWYELFDLLLLPSRGESLSLVMLEAAARGKPVVSFLDAGGSVEFLRDGAGVLVPYLDLEAMSQAVHRLALDEAERSRLGRAAAARVVERHTLDDMLTAITAVVEQAIASSAPEIFR